jgi:predicted amidohydrolase
MFRIGFYQFHPEFGQVQKNLGLVLNKLSGVDADLLVLPELAFTGYHFKDKSELLEMAEEPSHSSTVDRLADLCRQNNLHLVTGFAEKRNEKVYNSSFLIGPSGIIHIYRKIQLFFREKDYFEPGDIELQIHEVHGVRIGMMICFDWIFPEISRILALKGADVICHPANLVLSYCQDAMVTRCLENNVFAVTTNRFGEDSRPHGELKFTGKSQITAPRGNIIYRARAQKEELYITTIYPEEARDKMITEKNHLMEDRRTEWYHELSLKS